MIPIGMIGQRLEANVHVVTSSVAATQNLVTAANSAGILISDTVLEPLASAESCLTQDERDLGCCLLDIGGGTTELIVYGGGVVRHTSAVPIGGDHFTQRSGRRPAHADSRSRKNQAPATVAPPRELLARRRRHRNRQRGRPPAAHYFCAHAHRHHRAARQGISRDDSRRSPPRRPRQRKSPPDLCWLAAARASTASIELAEQSLHLPVRIAEPKGLSVCPSKSPSRSMQPLLVW